MFQLGEGFEFVLDLQVPVVRHPEFVFGGKWARTKHEAVSTSDSPTEACHATTILHLDKKQVTGLENFCPCRTTDTHL